MLTLSIPYRVGLQAQANFSAPTFEPAHEARAGQCATLSVESAAAAMQVLDERSTSKLLFVASSPRRKQRRADSIFAEQIEIFQLQASNSKIASYFQSKKRKSKLLDDR